VMLGEAHLRRTLAAFTDHYHLERNHQGLQDRLIIPTPARAFFIAVQRADSRSVGRSSDTRWA
jgi:hypothetical protein